MLTGMSMVERTAIHTVKQGLLCSTDLVGWILHRNIVTLLTLLRHVLLNKASGKAQSVYLQHLLLEQLQ